MTEPLDIEIGVVIRCKKDCPRNPVSRDKPAYYIFLGCFYDEDIKEWLVVLARTTSKINFFIDGKRQDIPHILINLDNKHPCFAKPSAISERDFYIIDAESLLNSVNNNNIEKKCSLNDNELKELKILFTNSKSVPKRIKKMELKEFIEYLIAIDYQ